MKRAGDSRPGFQAQQGVKKESGRCICPVPRPGSNLGEASTCLHDSSTLGCVCMYPLLVSSKVMTYVCLCILDVNMCLCFHEYKCMSMLTCLCTTRVCAWMLLCTFHVRVYMCTLLCLCGLMLHVCDCISACPCEMHVCGFACVHVHLCTCLPVCVHICTCVYP